MRRTVLVGLIAFAGCTGAAERDYGKCVAAEERGEYAAGIYACELAVAKDPAGSVGREASARIVAMQAAEAKRVASNVEPLRARPKPLHFMPDEDESPDLPGAQESGSGSRMTCEQMCMEGSVRCSMGATRSGMDLHCEASYSACLKSCAADAGPL